jgi:hypothetical protein
MLIGLPFDTPSFAEIRIHVAHPKAVSSNEHTEIHHFEEILVHLVFHKAIARQPLLPFQFGVLFTTKLFIKLLFNRKDQSVVNKAEAN